MALTKSERTGGCETRPVVYAIRHWMRQLHGVAHATNMCEFRFSNHDIGLTVTNKLPMRGFYSAEECCISLVVEPAGNRSWGWGKGADCDLRIRDTLEGSLLVSF